VATHRRTLCRAGGHEALLVAKLGDAARET
jgi:hypothetical protein